MALDGFGQRKCPQQHFVSSDPTELQPPKFKGHGYEIRAPFFLIFLGTPAQIYCRGESDEAAPLAEL